MSIQPSTIRMLAQRGANVWCATQSAFVIPKDSIGPGIPPADRHMRRVMDYFSTRITAEKAAATWEDYAGKYGATVTVQAVPAVMLDPAKFNYDALRLGGGL